MRARWDTVRHTLFIARFQNWSGAPFLEKETSKRVKFSPFRNASGNCFHICFHIFLCMSLSLSLLQMGWSRSWSSQAKSQQKPQSFCRRSHGPAFPGIPPCFYFHDFKILKHETQNWAGIQWAGLWIWWDRGSRYCGAANSQFERKSKTFTSSELIGYIQCDWNEK